MQNIIISDYFTRYLYIEFQNRKKDNYKKFTIGSSLISTVFSLSSGLPYIKDMKELKQPKPKFIIKMKYNTINMQ